MGHPCALRLTRKRSALPAPVLLTHARQIHRRAAFSMGRAGARAVPPCSLVSMASRGACISLGERRELTGAARVEGGDTESFLQGHWDFSPQRTLEGGGGHCHTSG